MLVSIAIPCYRSKDNIKTVVAAIQDEFKKHSGFDGQIVLVNDGSPDNTFSVIEQIVDENDNVTGIDLSRNYSQANAKMAALPFCEGEVVVYMDDDGQHPVSGIFSLVESILQGNDVVYADFSGKKKSGFFKVWTSSMYQKLSEYLGNKPKGIHTSSFLAISKLCRDKLLEYKSPSPSMGGYLYRVTTRFANVEMEQKKRISGASGYTLKKLVLLAVESLTNFTIVPLRIASIIGSCFSIIGFLILLIMVIRKLTDPSIALGYTSLEATILLTGGLILLFLGLIGEYIGRIYIAISDAPQYTIKKVVRPKHE